MTLPTMVSSSPPINEYCNDSDDSDEDDEQPPVLRQSNMDRLKMLSEAMQAASKRRQRQTNTKPPKPKTQPVNFSNSRIRQQPDQNISGNQLEQVLYSFLSQSKCMFKRLASY